MLVSRTQSTTVAKGSALKCCLDTFALSSAPLFASTAYEFSTGLGRFWQCGPVNFPSTCVLLLPPPVTWGWEFRDCNHHLSPAVTSLVGSPLCVLNQCCLCWRESFNVSTFLGEQLIACLIDWFQAASAVIEQYHESLQRLHPVVYGVWGGSQGTEGSSDVIKG